VSNRIKIVWMLVAMLASFLIIYALQIESNTRMNKMGQNFIRKYFDFSENSLKTFLLEKSDYYFAGNIGNRIYLGNITKGNFLLSINADLKDTHNVKLNISNDQSYLLRNTKIQLDPQALYLIQKDAHVIFESKSVNNPSLKFVRQFPDYVFDAIAVPDGLIIKLYDSVTRQNVIAKYEKLPRRITISRNLLQRQVDGIISTDGVISYDAERKLLFYIYYYRNQIICFDTNLKLIYRKSTIDTTSTANISLRYLKSADYTTFNTPPPFVNKTSCVGGNRIYILSTMVAKSDLPQKMDANAVIDVYSTLNAQYQGSFYIPNLKREKPHNLQVYANRLFVLQGNYIFSYALPKL
jgi:uncharacterized protein (UPF0333 family)